MQVQALGFSKHLPALRARAQRPRPRIPPAPRSMKIFSQPQQKSQIAKVAAVQQMLPRNGVDIEGVALVARGQLHQLHSPSAAARRRGAGRAGGERGAVVDVGPAVGGGGVVGDAGVAVDDVA